MRKIFIVIALMRMLLPLVADVMPEFKTAGYGYGRTLP